MQRRWVLAVAGSLAVSLAGCLSAVESSADEEPSSTPEPTPEPTPTSTPTPAPRYQSGDEPDLYVKPEDITGDWTRVDEREDSNFHTFEREDGTAALQSAVGGYQSVANARAEFAEVENRVRDPQAMAVGDEAIWSEAEDYAVVVFRHSNVLSEIRASRVSNQEWQPALPTAQRTADKQFDRWQEEF